MNKIFLILFLLAFSTLSYSQLGVQDYFFSINNDTLTFYFNEEGNITTKSKADFYRKAKLNTNILAYSGKLSDYFMNGQKAYECNYINNRLNGSVKCFYTNGKLKYCGYFKNSNKDSIWTFYYDNGNIEKIIRYYSDIPFIKELYKENGKMVFNNGSGKFKSVIRYSKEPLKCTISGKILNGKMEGAWHWTGEYAQGIEYFKHGDFIKSETYGLNDGFNKPRIISITGFDPHENVAIFDFLAIPKDSIENSMKIAGIPVTFKSKDIATSVSLDLSSTNNLPLKYKDSPNLRDKFSYSLTNYLVEAKTKKQITDFWCLIQFSVNEKNEIENIQTYSNKKEINQIIHEFLYDNNDFKVAIINNKAVECNVYLNILDMNNIRYIPDYRYNNSMINFFDLK